MGHYDMNCIIIRLGGVFSPSLEGVKLGEFAEKIKEEFVMDLFGNQDELYSKESNDLHVGTINELYRLVHGNNVATGTKGECFCCAKIDNFREHEQVVEDWCLITKKIPNYLEPITIITACENSDSLETSIVHNGKKIDAENFWNMYGLMDRFE